MIKAVLFGSLGTVTDLVALEREAFNQTFAQFDLDIFWEEYEYADLLAQGGRFKGVTDFVLGLKKLDHEAFFHHLEFAFREALDSAQPTPNVWTDRALQVLSQQRLTSVLVSGAHRQTVLRVLAAVYPHRASVIFDEVISAEAAARPKPAPDLYRAALKRLERTADEVIAIETTPDGHLAAEAAGIRTIGLPGQDICKDDLGKTDVLGDAGFLEGLRGPDMPDGLLPHKHLHCV